MQIFVLLSNLNTRRVLILLMCLMSRFSTRLSLSFFNVPSEVKKPAFAERDPAIRSILTDWKLPDLQLGPVSSQSFPVRSVFRLSLLSSTRNKPNKGLLKSRESQEVSNTYSTQGMKSRFSVDAALFGGHDLWRRASFDSQVQQSSYHHSYHQNFNMESHLHG